MDKDVLLVETFWEKIYNETKNRYRRCGEWRKHQNINPWNRSESA